MSLTSISLRPKHTDQLILPPTAGNGRKMYWRVLQMKIFLVVWDRRLDHVSEKAGEDGGEAVLKTQDWN